MSSRIVIACAAVAALVLLASCSKSGLAESGEAVPTRPSVAVEKATRSNLSRALTLTAEFIPYQEVDVMAKVSGYVRHIGVDIGDRVRAGQVLATIEVPEMADDLTKAAASVQLSDAEAVRARDEVERAKASHSVLHLTYQRLLDVSKTKPGLIAEQELDDAHAKDLESEARIAAAESSLEAARQHGQVNRADESRFHTLYNYSRVVAPFGGVITARYANQGSMIQAGTASQIQAMPVVKISQNTLLRLMLPVPESAVARIHLGQTVTVDVAALHKSFAGKVARFTDRVTTSTRTMLTEVDVPNPTSEIIPGMYAEVKLQLDSALNALSIPVSAIDLTADHPSVYKVSADTVDKTDVTLGLETANRVEVLSGLADGDMVVVGPRSTLKPGDKVRPEVVEIPAAKTES